jgi:hypothetical protein
MTDSHGESAHSILDDLPAGVPADLRAFLECTADSASIANGPVTWVEIPPQARGMFGGATHPELKVSPGTAPSTAILRISAGWVSATLPASVVDGRLAVDTSKLPFLAPPSIAIEIRRFVEAINGRLAANGKALGEPIFGPEGMTLRKVDRPG